MTRFHGDNTTSDKIADNRYYKGEDKIAGGSTASSSRKIASARIGKWTIFRDISIFRTS